MKEAGMMRGTAESLNTTIIDGAGNRALLSKLDSKSRMLVEYLERRKFASLDELQEILGETCHMNVLVRIKNSINKAALEELNRPVVQFHASHIDVETGENVLHCWWLADGWAGEGHGPRTLDLSNTASRSDVFCEENEVVVIFDLRGVSPESVLTRSEKNALYLEYVEEDSRREVTVSLPCFVDPLSMTRELKNQVLVVKLKRVHAR
jgi:hypothetical protein